MGYDILGGFKFGFSGLHDREILKWVLLLCLAMISGTMVTYAMVFLIPTLIAADWILFGIPLTTIAAIVFAALVTILYGIVALFFQYRIYANGIRLAGYQPPANTPSFSQFILVNVKMFVVNLFSWYDKRVLAIVLLLYAITVLWLAAGALVSNSIVTMIGVGFLAFSVLVHYMGIFLHSVRTAFGPLIYMRDGGFGPKAAQRSFLLVQGQTVDVLLAFLAGGIVFALAWMPSALLGMAIVGTPLEALIFTLGCLYHVNVFAHFDRKGPSEKQKKMREKKE